jgi:alkanesulfonate monooxygenase SsuD/methylene tetrahydromethanopterin reductase-like flavin-dependent oxidoreductase (luciferase family)
MVMENQPRRLSLGLRYDMRAPAIGAPASALYPAAVEQAAWADGLGFSTVYLAEHHGAEDGYLPSPMVLAAAMLARSRDLRVHFSALVAVLHHPIRLAEDIAVLDNISGGRVELTLGIGYRPDEFILFGVDRTRRGALLEEIIGVLEQAWSGEPFEFRGQTVQVLPRPVQRPRPPIHLGGSAPPSAIRAARLGDRYMPAAPGLWKIYKEERLRLGLDVPPPPPKRGPLFLHVTEDPERDWQVVGPHLLYTTNMNAQWALERGVGSTPYPPATEVEELKSSPEFAVVTPDECVALAEALGPDGELLFQPLMGGLAPEVGWRSLELFEKAVLPRLRQVSTVEPARVGTMNDVRGRN